MDYTPNSTTNLGWAPNLSLCFALGLWTDLQIIALGSRFCVGRNQHTGSKLPVCSRNLTRVQGSRPDPTFRAVSAVLGCRRRTETRLLLWAPHRSLGSQLSSGAPGGSSLAAGVGEGVTHRRAQWAAVMAQRSDSRAPPQRKRQVGPASRATCHGWECWTHA